MNTRLRFAGALGLLALLAGCATPGPYLPQDTAKYTLENTEKFVLLDRASQKAVTCTKLQEQILPDGRLEVIANVKNRINHRIEVQIGCVFKNAEGIASGDETPFQSLILAPYQTQSLKFTAMNDKSRNYTIRVRLPR